MRQHLIDPEICIRCNTCETMCPVGAVTHDSRNYVVDAEKCNWCNDCISPCPTGSIDNYRQVLRARAYSLEEQMGWDELPAELSRDQLTELAGAEVALEETAPALAAAASVEPGTEPAFNGAQFGATLPPWSAAHAYTNLYGPSSKNSASDKHITATVVGNVRVTELGKDYDTHHVVLDFGTLPFPVLEGQSIAIIPPGTDAQGRAHHPRQYSIASP
ncbi:MAG: 4Fe-4S binding protein, partial [Rubrivivax sp.]|nr:4Fe-4S binding protein [Rubrivivax sp.]